MSTSFPEDRWRFVVPAVGKAAVDTRREVRRRLIEEGLSRRRFLHVSASATGLALTGSAWSLSGLAATCEPQPIPHTLNPGGGLPPIHILLPGLAHPADADPSTITDFNGQVGYAIIDGTGTRTDLATNEVTTNPFEVDLRFMKGEFVGADGRLCHGAFALIWLDVFQTQVGSDQIHDFNPGIEASGLFWTAPIDTHDVLANPGSGRALMEVRNLAVPDFHDLVNAILGGPSIPGVVSFRVEWAASRDKQRFHNESLQYDGQMVLTSAVCAWTGETSQARYVSNPDPETLVSVYTEVGHVRNGVFFS